MPSSQSKRYRPIVGSPLVWRGTLPVARGSDGLFPILDGHLMGTKTPAHALLPVTERAWSERFQTCWRVKNESKPEPEPEARPTTARWSAAGWSAGWRTAETRPAAAGWSPAGWSAEPLTVQDRETRKPRREAGFSFFPVGCWPRKHGHICLWDEYGVVAAAVSLVRRSA